MLYYVGLTKEDRRKLFKATRTCSICLGKSKKRRLVIDHCHQSGIVRGVLCERCNSWLGVFEGKRSYRKKSKSFNQIRSRYGIPQINFSRYLSSFYLKLSGVRLEKISTDVDNFKPILSVKIE